MGKTDWDQAIGSMDEMDHMDNEVPLPPAGSRNYLVLLELELDRIVVVHRLPSPKLEGGNGLSVIRYNYAERGVLANLVLLPIRDRHVIEEYI